MTSIYQREIFEQPEALRRLARFYLGEDGQRLLGSPPQPAMPLFTGMGASYHAAWIAAFHAQALGIPATAIEAVDLLNYSQALLRSGDPLVYLSQSGKSGEVEPIAVALPPSVNLVAVTNDPDSPLAAHAGVTLPLLAGLETLIASKTYVNSLALLWLLVRQWGSRSDGSEVETLAFAAEAIERLLAAAEATTALWFETLANARTIVFLGHGPHAATARHSAMMLSEWAKSPALSAGVGAFHHGFIESVSHRLGFIVFAPPGRTAESALGLARTLQGYGARGLIVANGQTRRVDDAEPAAAPVDEFLSPLLDVIPVQLFADALARQRGVEPGFRYLSKVVTQL